MTKHRVEQPRGLNRSRPMHSSQAAVFFCGIFLQRFTCVACVDLNSLDYIAIGVSLTLAIVILAFLIVFYYLAQRRTAAGGNVKEMGQENPYANGYRTGTVQGITLTSLSSTSQVPNREPIYYNYVTYC